MNGPIFVSSSLPPAAPLLYDHHSPIRETLIKFFFFPLESSGTRGLVHVWSWSHGHTAIFLTILRATPFQIQLGRSQTVAQRVRYLSLFASTSFILPCIVIPKHFWMVTLGHPKVTLLVKISASHTATLNLSLLRNCSHPRDQNSVSYKHKLIG